MREMVKKTKEKKSFVTQESIKYNQRHFVKEQFQRFSGPIIQISLIAASTTA